jgi:hypothetical protein
MDDPDFREETVIGHHVAARKLPRNPLIRDDSAWAQLAGSPLLSPQIEIEVGDVDWDETQTVQLRLSTLRNIVEAFDE